MPELPDVTIYVERLEALVSGHTLEKIRLGSPFVLRSVVPPLSSVTAQRMTGCQRVGKRIALAFANGRFVLLHLMIAGRLRLRERGEKLPAKVGLAAFDFDHATILFTEASPKKRAWMRLIEDEASLASHDPGGLDVFRAAPSEFAAVLRSESHTLKRALTDPTLFDGIGNAYSDEILHKARLSPVALTGRLSEEESLRLYHACRDVLELSTASLRREVGEGFPEKVTAFREGMAVHGRFQQPCPVCGAAVQRIKYADNEVNYCPGCQTGGKLLADRALSRLLKSDWPRSLAEMEEHLRSRREAPLPG